MTASVAWGIWSVGSVIKDYTDQMQQAAIASCTAEQLQTEIDQLQQRLIEANNEITGRDNSINILDVALQDRTHRQQMAFEETIRLKNTLARLSKIPEVGEWAEHNLPKVVQDEYFAN